MPATPTCSNHINWDPSCFQQINWYDDFDTATTIPTTGTPKPLITDGSLNTLAFDGLTNGVPNKPREIGLHVIYSKNGGEAARNTYYDDFYLDIQMTTGGSSTGGVYLQ